MAYDVGKLVRADSSLNMAVGNALRIDEKAEKDIRTRIQRNSMMDEESSVTFSMFSVTIENNKISVSEGVLYYNLDPVEVPDKENVVDLSAGYLLLKVTGANPASVGYIIESEIPSMPKDGTEEVKYPIARIDSTTGTDGNSIYSIVQYRITQPPMLFAFGKCDGENNDLGK